MIMPTGKLEVSSTESLEIIIETPLNTKPKILYAVGEAYEGRFCEISGLEDYERFVEKNNITHKKDHKLTTQECAILKAYIELIKEASKEGFNAAEITGLTYHTTSKYGNLGEVTSKECEIILTARVYRLPKRE